LCLIIYFWVREGGNPNHRFLIPIGASGKVEKKEKTIKNGKFRGRKNKDAILVVFVGKKRGEGMRFVIRKGLIYLRL